MYYYIHVLRSLYYSLALLCSTHISLLSSALENLVNPEQKPCLCPLPFFAATKFKFLFLSTCNNIVVGRFPLLRVRRPLHRNLRNFQEHATQKRAYHTEGNTVTERTEVLAAQQPTVCLRARVGNEVVYVELLCRCTELSKHARVGGPHRGHTVV